MGSPPTSDSGTPAETSASPLGLSAAVALLLFSVSAAAHELRGFDGSVRSEAVAPHTHDTSLCPEHQYWYFGSCFDNEIGAARPPAAIGRSAQREAAKPRVESVDILSTPVRDGTYAVGEWIRVRVTFDKDITVQGSPTLHLEIGVREQDYWLTRDNAWVPTRCVGCCRHRVRTIVERTASRDTTTRNYRPNRAIIFAYQVRADDLDGNGITIKNDALSGGSIQGDFTYEIHIETPGGGGVGTGPAFGWVPSTPWLVSWVTALAPSPAYASPGTRTTVTERVDAYTELGAHAITDDAGHKVDGRKRRVPTFGSKTAGPFRFDSGAAVSRTLPAADGGDGSVTYTIERPGTPNTAATLPCGLAFTGSGRLLAAASTATGKLHPADCTSRNTRYTLAAADVDGDRATLEFVLAAGSALTFGDTAGPTLAFRTGHLVEFELPAAEGGDGRVDYTLGATPALPNGLGFLRVRRGSNAEQSRTLWGTPGRAHPRTTYTLTATDRDGDPGLHHRGDDEPHPVVPRRHSPPPALHGRPDGRHHAARGHGR